MLKVLLKHATAVWWVKPQSCMKESGKASGRKGDWTGKFGRKNGFLQRKKIVLEQWPLCEAYLGTLTRLMQLQQERRLGKEVRRQAVEGNI